MTLDALIMLVGAFVAALPFLGLPNSWDAAIFVVLGVLVIAFGIVVRRRSNIRAGESVREANFEERMPHPQYPEHGQA